MLTVHNPIALFEENYQLLLGLLPELCDGEGDHFLMDRRGSGAVMEIVVLERCRYTTMLSLKMPFASGTKLLPDLSMRLRLYHDAQVAEVTDYQGCGRIPAPYQVTCHAPYLIDEKRQVNRLLHELLRHCQRHGYRALLEQDSP